MARMWTSVVALAGFSRIVPFDVMKYAVNLERERSIQSSTPAYIVHVLKAKLLHMPFIRNTPILQAP